MSLERKVTVHDVKTQKFKLMPGFKFKWYYSGMDVVPIDKYYNDPSNKITNTFVRNRPIICNDLFIHLFIIYEPFSNIFQLQLTLHIGTYLLDLQTF